MSNCPECDKVLKNPKKCACGWTLSAKHDDAPAFKPGCSAHGCTMPGSISNSTHGSHSWLCHMHFRAPVSNWQTVTDRIRKNYMLVNLIKEIRNAQNGGQFDYKGWMATLTNSGLEQYWLQDTDRSKSTGKYSPRMWLARMEKTLYGIVMQGMDEEIQSTTSSSIENLMDEIEKFLKGHGMNGFGFDDAA
jgi:hypothetical protein